MFYKLSITKDEMKEFYLSGKTMQEIADIANCNVTNIHSHLRRMGVKSRSFAEASRKYSLDETYFEKIDTEEKAYFLGFLYADGYNFEKKGLIELSLQDRDLHILIKFRELLQYENAPILYKSKRPHRSLFVYSGKISRDLAALGCMQAKTFKIEFPTFIDESLIRHFIRGYFDGDGCIHNPKKRDVQLSVLGNIKFITALQDHFIKVLNVNRVKLHQRFKHCECYTLAYHGIKLPLKVLNYLYKDSTIHLDRKYKKYLSILEQ